LGIEQEVLEHFLRKIEAERVSANVLAGLKRLWENDELDSKEKLLEVFKGKNENALH